MMNDYLDVGIVTVKPEKRGEFEAIIKKMVDANRKHQGDNWLTTEMMFGPGQHLHLRESSAKLRWGGARVWQLHGRHAKSPWELPGRPS